MGVRFECPAGHKLHVKVHLAGQRGICPECGVRFIVPSFSGGRVAEAPGSDSGRFEAGGSGSGYVSVALESSAPFESGVNLGAAVAWYVRPATGGQFGPVDTPTFQQWVREGRVGADSWVWRTGWAQWKARGEALQLLAAERAARPPRRARRSRRLPRISRRPSRKRRSRRGPPR